MGKNDWLTGVISLKQHTMNKRENTQNMKRARGTGLLKSMSFKLKAGSFIWVSSEHSPPPPHSLPRMLLFLVWCRGYCFKRQLLFLLSGKPSSFTSPEMKAKSRLWECSLKTPLKRDSYHHISMWELHFPCFSLIRAEGVSVRVSLVEEQRQTVVTEKDVSKLSLSVVVHWVPHSVELHCSDSVCLPDYLKVSLLQRANRITLLCSVPLFLCSTPTRSQIIR